VPVVEAPSSVRVGLWKYETELRMSKSEKDLEDACNTQRCFQGGSEFQKEASYHRVGTNSDPRLICEPAWKKSEMS
jgi:hypothetical protein